MKSEKASAVNGGCERTRYTGLRSSVVCTAATKGSLFSKRRTDFLSMISPPQVGIIYRDRPLNEATQRQACRATMPTAKIESTTNTRAGATPMTAAQLLSPRRLSPKLSARLGAHIEAQ